MVGINLAVAGPGFDLRGRGLCQRGGVENHLEC